MYFSSLPGGRAGACNVLAVQLLSCVSSLTMITPCIKTIHELREKKGANCACIIVKSHLSVLRLLLNSLQGRDPDVQGQLLESLTQAQREHGPPVVYGMGGMGKVLEGLGGIRRGETTYFLA